MTEPELMHSNWIKSRHSENRTEGEFRAAGFRELRLSVRPDTSEKIVSTCDITLPMQVRADIGSLFQLRTLIT